MLSLDGRRSTTEPARMANGLDQQPRAQKKPSISFAEDTRGGGAIARGRSRTVSEIDSSPGDAEVGPKRSRASSSSVADLPDLMDRIHEMGLSDEYLAYRERYLGWRMGKAQGAGGELNARNLVEKHQTRSGWGYWYPTMEEWQWKRTLSYWIAVTFFEGSLFFTFSSFAGCYADHLGHLKHALTLWGYTAGKVNYFICTYLMCLETINMTNADDGHHHKGSMKSIVAPDEDESSSDDTSSTASSEEGESCMEPAVAARKRRRHFRLWPFHWRTALGNLSQLGVGPWPYFASAAYLIGVLSFTVGLAVELIPGFSEPVIKWTVFFSFTLGSLWFTFGGIFECIENGVFSRIRCADIGQGYLGAFLNMIGGFLFLIGSIMFLWDDWAFEGNFMFGVGSAIFLGGSSVMIIMWKDEQFGLTFLAVLNHLGGPSGRPVVKKDQEAHEENTFSLRGACFIMIYCLTATASIYDFLIVLFDDKTLVPRLVVIERGFNSLLPAVFAHMMLALNAGVFKTPEMAPFHQLYIACRWIALVMVANSSCRVYMRIVMATEEEDVVAQD